MLDAVVFVEIVFQDGVACETVDHQIVVPFYVVRLYLPYLITKENYEHILSIQLRVFFYEK